MCLGCKEHHAAFGRICLYCTDEWRKQTHHGLYRLYWLVSSPLSFLFETIPPLVR